MKIYFIHYFEKILKICFTSSKPDTYLKYVRYVYKGLKSLRLESFFMQYHYGFKFLWFMNSYLLLLHSNWTSFFNYQILLFNKISKIER